MGERTGASIGTAPLRVGGQHSRLCPGGVREIENKMTSAVLLNLSEIWAAMDARATAAGIADEHVWGRTISG